MLFWRRTAPSARGAEGPAGPPGDAGRRRALALGGALSLLLAAAHAVGTVRGLPPGGAAWAQWSIILVYLAGTSMLAIIDTYVNVDRSALLIGLLIGVQRETDRAERHAGLRDFLVLGLAGGSEDVDGGALGQLGPELHQLGLRDEILVVEPRVASGRDRALEVRPPGGEGLALEELLQLAQAECLHVTGPG